MCLPAGLSTIFMTLVSPHPACLSLLMQKQYVLPHTSTIALAAAGWVWAGGVLVGSGSEERSKHSSRSPARSVANTIPS